MDFLPILLSSLFAIIFFFFCLTALSRTSGEKLPPGPTPLPLIGNLHLLGHQPHKSLAELAGKYGPIMRLKLGQITTVVISSSAVAKEALQKQDSAFSSRSIPDALHAHDHYKYSVVWLPAAARWRSLRKVLNTQIFSNHRLDTHQQVRSRKIMDLVSYCKKQSQSGGWGVVDVGQAAFRTTVNLLSNTIFSKDLTDSESESAKEFKDLVWDIMVEAGKPNLVDFFPVLRRFDPQGIRGRMKTHFGKVLKLFGGLIDERLEERKLKGGTNNDVLDVLLNISEENAEEIDRIHIERLFLDLYSAGTDTTSSTIEWALAEVLKNPEIMIKAQEELAQVIGKGKPIEEADLTHLPYLQCIVKETLRMHPPVPFLIRKVEKNVEVYGYTVPGGAHVLVNVWAIGRDSSVWENPLRFKPERLWESKIDVRGVDFELLPFGAGRRICPGLSLTTRMVPLMLGSLLNTFDWKLDEDIRPEELDMEEKFAITLQKAHPLRVIPIPL